MYRHESMIVIRSCLQGAEASNGRSSGSWKVRISDYIVWPYRTVETNFTKYRNLDHGKLSGMKRGDWRLGLGAYVCMHVIPYRPIHPSMVAYSIRVPERKALLSIVIRKEAERREEDEQASS